MKLLSPAPRRGDQTCVFENREMFRNGLPRHVHVFAKLAQGLSIPRMEAVEELSTTWIGERPEDRVHAHKMNMQLYGCMSRVGLALAFHGAARHGWFSDEEIFRDGPSEHSCADGRRGWRHHA